MNIHTGLAVIIHTVQVYSPRLISLQRVRAKQLFQAHPDGRRHLRDRPEFWL